MLRQQGEVVPDAEFGDCSALPEVCRCSAFSFTHIAYAGDCEGPQRGGELPHLEIA
jgi:hypothetical protein